MTVVDSREPLKATYVLPKHIGTDSNFKMKIVWPNAIGFLIMHVAAVYGLILTWTSASRLTTIWSILLALVAAEGVTVGAHRMYSHKAFKATVPVKIVLLLFQTIAGQNCCWIWTRDHRLHHKYADTDADPHNATRGFWFSHIGWLMTKKHPLVIQKGREIDMTDLNADPYVMFQKRYYKTLYYVFAFFLPITIPHYFWCETLWNSLFVSYFFRYVYQLNVTWAINSFTHIWGYRPYDKNQLAVENDVVSYLALGEGYHNYHHAFPSDYRAAEFGFRTSFTTEIIDILAFFGGVYDLKEAPCNRVKNKSVKQGDGSHHKFGLSYRQQYAQDVFDVNKKNFADYKNIIKRASSKG